MGKQRWACVSVPGRMLFGNASPAATLLTNTSIAAGANGLSILQSGTSANSGLSFGANAGMQLNISSGIIVFKNLNTTTQQQVLFNTQFDTSSASGGFIVFAYSGAVRLDLKDAADLLISSNTLGLGETGRLAWSYNNVTGRARIALNGILTSGTATASFTHGPVGVGGYYSDSGIGTNPMEESLLALSPDECLDDSALIYASLNPWELFRPLKRSIYYPPNTSVQAFSISPNAGHTSGSVAINVTYSGGALAPSSGGVPLSILSGGGSVTAGSWVQDSSTTGHFTFVAPSASGTPTVFSDIITATTQSYSNAAVVPGPPLSPIGTHGNGQVSVAFTTPTDNGGSAITGYTATASPGGLTGTGATTPIVVTGLTNGTPYTFTVTATNSVGTGTPSSASSAVTPSTAPSTPTIGTASPGSSSASVAFTPGATGGATPTYVATSTPGSFTGSGFSSPITVPGLSNGTPYTFTVHATNIDGTSSESAASSPVTPSAAASMVRDAPIASSDIPPTIIAQTMTLSSAAVGTGRTATAGGGTPFAGTGADVGKFLWEIGGNGLAVVTAAVSTTVCTVQVVSAFTGTVTAASQWSFAQPSFQPYQIVSGALSAIGSPVTTGFNAVPNTKSLRVVAQLSINGSFGDVAAIGVFSGVNGTISRAIALNSPPTSLPTAFVACEIAPFTTAALIGEPVAQTLTLSSSAVGSRTFTAGGGTPFSTGSNPVGRYIFDAVGTGRAIITARTSDTVVTAMVIDAFSGTSYGSNGWNLGAPRWADSTVSGTTITPGVMATTGIIAIPGVQNGFVRLRSDALDVNHGCQVPTDWDGNG